MLSFLFPFAILGTVFALHGVYPFGDRQALILDMGDQHYPFLNDFWHRIRGGNLAPWSWNAGLGSDYISLFAYYLASPLNLLTLLVPQALLREALTLILLVKIGLAGLFAGMFLRYANLRYINCQKKADVQTGLALPVFSSLYALCGFTLGYYTQTIWFDSFALLPLVIFGLLALLREGKFILYTVSLALAVFANFYNGFYICIFIVITFFSQCIIQKYNRQEFLRKLV